MIVKQTLIYCDNENCKRKGVPLGNGDLSEEPAWFQLKGSGWGAFKGRGLYCPECQEEMRRGL